MKSNSNHKLVASLVVVALIVSGIAPYAPTIQGSETVQKGDRSGTSATLRGGSAKIYGGQDLSPFCDGDFKLIGADNVKLHLENINWYRESARRKQETDQDLNLLHQKIQELSNQYFPKELKARVASHHHGIHGQRNERNQMGIKSYTRSVC